MFWLTKKGLKFLWLVGSFGLLFGGCASGKADIWFAGFLLLFFFVFILYKRVRRWWWQKVKAAIKRAETKEAEAKKAEKTSPTPPDKKEEFYP